MPNDEARNPLISDRSPSYGSARREHLHPSPAPDPQVVAVLNELVEIELDLAATCDAAAEAASDPILAAACAHSADEHRVRVGVLSDHVRELGAAPPEEDDVFPAAVPHSADDLREVVGDARIEHGIAVNRSFVVRRYELALRRPELSEHTREILVQLSQASQADARGTTPG